MGAVPAPACAPGALGLLLPLYLAGNAARRLRCTAACLKRSRLPAGVPCQLGAAVPGGRWAGQAAPHAATTPHEGRGAAAGPSGLPTPIRPRTGAAAIALSHHAIPVRSGRCHAVPDSRSATDRSDERPLRFGAADGSAQMMRFRAADAVRRYWCARCHRPGARLARSRSPARCATGFVRGHRSGSPPRPKVIIPPRRSSGPDAQPAQPARPTSPPNQPAQPARPTSPANEPCPTSPPTHPAQRADEPCPTSESGGGAGRVRRRRSERMSPVRGSGGASPAGRTGGSGRSGAALQTLPEPS